MANLSDERAPPTSSLRGRLFGHRKTGEGCTVEVRGGGIAVRVDSGSAYELRLEAAELTYGGTNNDMLVIVAASGESRLSLYLPRTDALPSLLRMGNVWLDRQLDQLAVRDASHQRRRAAWSLGLFAAVVAALVIGYVALDVGISWGIGKVPIAWEVSLGQTLMDELHAPSTRVDNPDLRKQIDPIVERLLAVLPASGYEFQVHIIVDQSVNAFALPGGQIALHTGLLAVCRTPEELAGVLAHEIQHVLHRHTLLKLAYALKWRVALSLLIGDLGTVSNVLLANGADLLSLSNSREAEREADRSGVELLYDARVDPHGMVGFFEGMRESNKDLGLASYVSTHPADAERVATIGALIDQRAPFEFAPFDVDWAAMKAALKGAATGPKASDVRLPEKPDPAVAK